MSSSTETILNLDHTRTQFMRLCRRLTRADTTWSRQKPDDRQASCGLRACARYLRVAPVEALPRDERELMIAANNGDLHGAQAGHPSFGDGSWVHWYKQLRQDPSGIRENSRGARLSLARPQLVRSPRKRSPKWVPARSRSHELIVAVTQRFARLFHSCAVSVVAE
jgi:hypothetical protein